MSDDGDFFEKRGSVCRTCGHNYYSERSFCEFCGSVDLGVIDYNSWGVSGAMMEFENFVRDSSEFTVPWGNITLWFSNLDNIYNENG